jgi:hypothetical protein
MSTQSPLPPNSRFGLLASEMGQKRRFGTRSVTSALALSTDIAIYCERPIFGRALQRLPGALRMFNSSFQLVNGLVGAAKPSAQLAPKTRKQLDGDSRRILRKSGELLLAENVANNVVVGDDGS